MQRGKKVTLEAVLAFTTIAVSVQLHDCHLCALKMVDVYNHCSILWLHLCTSLAASDNSMEKSPIKSQVTIT